MPAMPPASGAVEPQTYVALCGGVGGAKLAVGLQAVLGKRLTLAVNVGDDFDHLGLRICPDIDTVLYTLSGRNDETRGWGRAGETWQFMSALGELGGETWFNLGDLDLALHVVRTRRLLAGEPLSKVTKALAGRLGITAGVVPVTDDELRTKVICSEGTLDFQRYFVERQCQPKIERLLFEGSETARLTPEIEEALSADSLAGIIVCPSNPYLSIDPILAIPKLQALLRDRRVPAVAVSPIIGGKSVKGPTSKIMDELGVASTSLSIARHYAGLIDGLLVDEVDASDTKDCGIAVCSTPTLMTNAERREMLARKALQFIADLS